MSGAGAMGEPRLMSDAISASIIALWAVVVAWLRRGKARQRKRREGRGPEAVSLTGGDQRCSARSLARPAPMEGGPCRAEAAGGWSDQGILGPPGARRRTVEAS